MSSPTGEGIVVMSESVSAIGVAKIPSKELGAYPLAPGDGRTVAIRITRADNQIALLVQQNLVFCSAVTRRDPLFLVDVEITSYLVGEGRTVVNLMGIDTGGASHYAFALVVGGVVVPGFSVNDFVPHSTKIGVAAHYTLYIDR